MRKMKKINGYLIVRFNDRERREWPQIGTFGVIDAELYTGHFEIDMGEFEYNDADTIEAAIEQARGMESEMDFTEPEVKITVIKETNAGSDEDEVDPEALFRQEKAILEKRIENGHYPDTNPHTAAHELYGYTRALIQLGMIDDTDERFHVAMDAFGAHCGFQDDEGHHVDVLLPYHGAMAHLSPHDFAEVETYTNCTVQTLKCRRCGQESFAWNTTPLSEEFGDELKGVRQLMGLLKEIREYDDNNGGASAAPGQSFRHGHKSVGERRTQEIYALGIRLLGECPENDCGIFRNIFKMAVNIDEQLGKLTGYAREVMEAEFGRKLRELEKMYLFNYAVKEYRKEAAG